MGTQKTRLGERVSKGKEKTLDDFVVGPAEPGEIHLEAPDERRARDPGSTG